MCQCIPISSMYDARGVCVFTVRDWEKRKRRFTRVSLGSLNMISRQSGSSCGGSGGRHSDLRSFSSASVCEHGQKHTHTHTRTVLLHTRPDPLVTIEQKHGFCRPPSASAPRLGGSGVPPLPPAVFAPAPPFFCVPSPDRRAERPGTPRPAAAAAPASGSALP